LIDAIDVLKPSLTVLRPATTCVVYDSDVSKDKLQEGQEIMVRRHEAN